MSVEYNTLCNCDSVNYVDPQGLWRQVGTNIWEAQENDTLSGLSYALYRDWGRWTEFGYQYDPKTLQVGEIIDITGRGLVGRNLFNGTAEFYGGGQLYPVMDPPAPVYTYTPPEPVSKPQPPVSGSSSNSSPAKPNPGSSSSTSYPGKGGKPSSGGSDGKGSIFDKQPNYNNIDYPPDFIGPTIPYKTIVIGGMLYMDVTDSLNAALKKTVEKAEKDRKRVNGMSWGTQYWGELGLYIDFFFLVNHKAPWDIKRRDPWIKTIGMPFPGYGVEVYYSGYTMTPEELGNFTYGYIGTAYGFSSDTLLKGSFIAAGTPLYGEKLENEYEDWVSIKMGIREYLSFRNSL